MITDSTKLEAIFTDELLALLDKPSDKYVRFPLPKKTGGVRWISSPVPILKQAQKDFLALLEIPSVQQTTSRGTHEVITGFIPGMSILDNARPHVGQKVVLSMDLKDFFGSVRPVDLNIRVPHLVYRRIKQIMALCFTSKGLPQGSPASPMLANWSAVLADMAIVSRLAVLKGRDGIDIAYTRYADDLTFSGDVIPEDFVQGLIRDASRLFNRKAKFANNKINFMRNHKRQMVTGIIVNEKMSIPRERRMKLRAIKHRIETKGIDSVENYSFHEIMGELSYLHLTDKQKARDMIDMLLAL